MKTHDDMCDVSPISARELAEQVVSDLQLSPGLMIVVDSTPGFQSWREEREIQRGWRHLDTEEELRNQTTM